MYRIFWLMLLLITSFTGVYAGKALVVTSPDKQIRFIVNVDHKGLYYEVFLGKEQLVNHSALQLSLIEGGAFSADLGLQFGKINHLHEDYTLLVGKNSKVASDCNQVIVYAEERRGAHRKLNLEIRVFNDGAAFRYEVPKQQGLDSIHITQEKSVFNVSQNPAVLTLFRENFTTSHEGIYDKLPLNQIKADTLMDLPALFSFPKGVFMAITEANLRDYGGMYLIKKNGQLQSEISPLPKQPNVKVIGKLPHKSPWRVMIIGNRMGALMESNILTNLSDPCVLKDVSWIKPGKTTFPWWNGNIMPDTTFEGGNDYQTNMYYVNFCAKNSIAYHTVVEYGQHEWYVNDGAGYNPGPHADPATPVALLDMQKLCDSAKALGVGIRVWVHFYALYPQLEKTFAQYEKWGIKGLMCDFMDRDDQEMVNMQEEILKKAAEHHLHIQFHGAYKPTGLARTYPNEFTREGTLNYENDKWSKRVTPDADINIPFTRGLAGSTDYHLGGFRAANPSNFIIRYTKPMVMGTRCHMLAMYVVLENEQGMVCDDPTAYNGQPGFDFLKEVPINWDETKAVNAEISKYVTIARRKGSDWFVGTINNNEPRMIVTPLSFLPEGDFTAKIYSDAPEDGQNPNLLTKTVMQVNRHTVLKTNVAKGGGQVLKISLVKKAL